MSFINPWPPTMAPRKTDFVGIYAELCFVPDWLRRTPLGYATLTAKEFSGTSLAHRLVAMLLLGQLADGDRALHRCGTAHCHNPHHLYVAGDIENHRDKLLHEQAAPRWGALGLTCLTGSGQVFMPQPLVFSEEACRLTTNFGGFTPVQCFHCDWLHPTPDGFRQLRDTTMSGDVVGAHRKVYTLFVGPLDKYDIVSHSCGDQTCLNPFHLRISGRQASPRDFDVKHDKRFRLSAYGLAQIADFTRSTTELAKELGVHRQTVAGRRADLRRHLHLSDGSAL